MKAKALLFSIILVCSTMVGMGQEVSDEEKTLDKTYELSEVDIKPCAMKCRMEKDQELRDQCSQGEVIKHVVFNVKYPPLSKDKGVSGTVWIEFVVNTEGNIVDARVKESVHPKLDKEALRSVSTLPKMLPAQINGESCQCRMSVPIKFSLRS